MAVSRPIVWSQSYWARIDSLPTTYDQGFLWRYAPVRRTGTFFPK